MRKEHVTLDPDTTAGLRLHRQERPAPHPGWSTRERSRSSRRSSAAAAAAQELLACKHGRAWVDVLADINEYLQDATGDDFSAKDFRTWAATVLAAIALAVSGEVATPTGRKRAVVRAVKEVSHYLGTRPRSAARPTSTRA